MAATLTSEIKVVGKSGQISIGKSYAGKMLELQRLADATLLLRAVAVVPESQLWTLQEPDRSRIERGSSGPPRRHRASRTRTACRGRRASDGAARVPAGCSRARQWEAIRHIRTPNGATAYSLMLRETLRAIAYRDDEFLGFISLHPDHDSA